MRSFKSCGCSSNRTLCLAVYSMKHNIHTWFLTSLLYVVSVTLVFNDESYQTVSRDKRALVHINGSILQFAFGVQSPVDIPNRTITLAVGLQANYKLPSNVSEFRDKRQLHRLTTYNYLERVLNDFGYHGRECLLRTICEVADLPFHRGREDTLMEEIMHIILTPSEDSKQDCSSTTHECPEDYAYMEAENHGRDTGDCKSKFHFCPESPLDLISSYFD